MNPVSAFLLLAGPTTVQEAIAPELITMVETVETIIDKPLTVELIVDAETVEVIMGPEVIELIVEPETVELILDA